MDDGEISSLLAAQFFRRTSPRIYTLDNHPLEDDLLKNARYKNRKGTLFSQVEIIKFSLDTFVITCTYSYMHRHSLSQYTHAIVYAVYILIESAFFLTDCYHVSRDKN